MRESNKEAFCFNSPAFVCSKYGEFAGPDTDRSVLDPNFILSVLVFMKRMLTKNSGTKLLLLF